MKKFPKFPKAVLFDFDGTLADTAPDMLAALNRWLQVRGRAAVDTAAASKLCSGGARALLRFCGTSEEELDSAVDEYLQYYQQTDYRQTALYDGIGAVLARLNADGVRWGVATNKPITYFAPIAERLLAEWQPAALVARDDAALPAKPHPATLLAAAQQCGAPPEYCVYVGDDLRDAQAASAAGMRFIGVTWGYWREEQWQELDDAPCIHALISAPPLLLTALRSVDSFSKQ